MRYIFSISLFICFALAVYIGIQFLLHKEKKYLENRLFSLFCFASAVWSFGFGGLFLQTDVDTAYIWRAIGMLGVFPYLILVQFIVCNLADVKKLHRNLSVAVACLGIPLYFGVIQKNQVIYELSDIGMRYFFKPGFINNAYILYSLISGCNVLVGIICMCASRTRRRRIFGRKFLLAELVLICGMVLDTVFPIIGIGAVPGSSLAQFLCLMVLYHAMSSMNRSRVTISNMSEFIYYSLATPVLVYDEERRLQIMNDAAVSFLRVDREAVGMESMGMDTLFVLEEEDVFSFEGKHKEVETKCRKNRLFCNLDVSKIWDDYGDIIGYIVIITDLSEHMRNVERLKAAIADAESANQAKSTFLANMSHEIRTPMNAIVGFSELVLKADIDDQVREYVEDIRWSAHNLLAIINDILDISKIESGKMELVCDEYYMASLLDDVCLIISTQAKQKGLEFCLKMGDGIPRKLYGDKIRLRGILINLLNNAVKYTREGSVTFEVNALQKEGDSVTLGFRIIDTGVGIKEEEQEHLFESFVQVERKVHYGVEGSGLGLAIVKGYLALMDGEVSVRSVYGEGSTFTVVVDQKIVDGSALDPASMDMKSSHYTDNGIGNMKIVGCRVLVVDDNLVNLKVAGNSLKYYGLTVDTASSGREAVELCRRYHYNIVLLDQMMPEMDGVETMREIRKLDDYYGYGGEGKLIVLTADAISGARVRLIKEGFDEYLGKPINFRQLERLFVRFLPEENIRLEQEKQLEAEQETQEQEVAYLKQMLPEVDVDQGIVNCGGKTELYRRVLKIAYQYGETQLEELKSYWKQRDYENYTIKVHAMKSSTLNLGARKLSDMAREQEMAGKSGTYDYIDAHMEEFRQEYRRLLSQIGEVLAHYELPEETQQETEEMPEEMVRRILTGILKCVEDFEFTRVFDILEELDKCGVPEAYEELFARIRHGMDELAVDEIRELICAELAEQ